MKTFYLTDSGKVRDHNEDSVTILKNANNEQLLIVADGMGGHRAGEVASSMVVTHMGEKFGELSTIGSKIDAINWLKDNICQINTEILDHTKKHPEALGMGTTAVMALLTSEYLIFANIGDSSGFVYKNGKLYIAANTRVYGVIDSILERKPELYFRIYGLYDDSKCDLSFLERMPHLKKLRIDCHLRSCPDKIDFNILTRLKLKALHLDAFELKDYNFIQFLSPELEELVINADTMGGSIQFDCKWLLHYPNLKNLWLGKKAEKNLRCIAELPALESLSLRGIKLTDFEFLKKMNLQ